MKLTNKLFALLVIGIMVPLIGGIFLTYYSIKTSVEKIEIEKAVSNMSSVKTYIDSMAEAQGSNYTAWTMWTEYYEAIKKNNKVWIEENVFSSAKENTASEIVITLDKDGKVIDEINMPKDWVTDYKDTDLYKKLGPNGHHASGIEKKSNGLYLLTIVKVVKSEDEDFGDFSGYTVYARKVTSQMIEQGEKVVGVGISLLLDGGKAVGENNAHEGEFKDKQGNPIFADIKIFDDNMRAQTKQLFKDSSNKPIGSLIVETASTAGVLALNKLFKYSLFLVILVMVLSTSILIWLELSVVAPIKKITSVISKKDLSEELTVKGNDEIAGLCREFNSFIQNMVVSMKQLRTTSKEVELSSREFLAAIGESNKAMEQITAVIDSTTALDENIIELKKIVDSATIIELSSKEIQTIIEKLEVDSDSINDSAQKGANSLGQIASSIEVTKDKFRHSVGIIGNLTGSVTKITEFIEMIRSISKQTNLLALNAAIEAAKAGEAGKGFIVVADEIRKLAHQTESAAEKINGNVSNILELVDSSQESIQEVEEQILNAEQVSGITLLEINSILQNIIKVTSLISGIAEQYIVQNSHIQQITSEISNIEGAFEKIGEDFTDISATTEEQVATLEELTAKSHEMSSTTGILNEIVQQFKGI